MERAAFGKLAVDFYSVVRLRARMDEDTSNLIAQLCTLVGMTMEDANVVALTVPGMTRDERLAAIVELDITTKRIGVLVDAARALMT